jgi:transcriptional regulator with XRE-family HTH domain
VTNAPPPKPRQVQLVGRKIRDLRKRHKLTQTELAARIGIQQSDLSRMEQGQYRVSLDTLFKILAEFEMSISDFFGEVGQRRTVTSRDARVLSDFKSLDERGQREVEEFIAFKRSKEEKEANGNDR